TGIQNKLAPLASSVYSTPLKSFEKKVNAWDKGEMTNEEFIGLLLTEAARLNGSINLKRFPTLAAFVSNVRIGPTPPALRPESLPMATADFFAQSSTYLSAEEKKNLGVLAKQTDPTAYYLYVRELVYKHQLFLAVPPELASYLEYLHTARTLGMDRVLHEA